MFGDRYPASLLGFKSGPRFHKRIDLIRLLYNLSLIHDSSSLVDCCSTRCIQFCQCWRSVDGVGVLPRYYQHLCILSYLWSLHHQRMLLLERETNAQVGVEYLVKHFLDKHWKSTALNPSPWGVPGFAVKECCWVAPLIFILITVLLSRKRIILTSSSFTISLSMCKSLLRFMVSNTADMSIPVIWILSPCVTLHFPVSHRCVHKRSAALLFGWKPLCSDDIYFKTASLIWDYYT